MSYSGYGHVVDSCPHNETEFTAASTRLNCGVDKFGYNQYTCAPKYDVTSLVEFCYNLTVGYYPKDHCLRVVSDGGLQSYSCGQFTEGCPSDHYRGSDLYQFPACSQINTEQRCFYADPSCPKETASNTTEDGAIPIESTTLMNIFNATANASSTFTTHVEKKYAYIWIIIGIFVVFGIFALISLAWLLWRRTVYSRVPEAVELPRREKLIAQCIGKYSTWKTPTSDQFSSLSDGEVCVLFCFMCSDSGTPDFTDTNFLDILNQIRKVYRKGSITNEEAQRTLDGLKSRDFLWDEDGVHLTNDVKDEAMYLVTERAIGYIYNTEMYHVYRLSNDTTAVRYLRSQRYTRKSGEKCIISDDPRCDPLLIRRLQMDILTHVTMEDTEIYDEVSRYLNIPPDRVRMSDDERGAFLEELKQTGECIQYRGGSRDCVQHVNWLWRDERPDIVKSCIGLHPHYDIYIINNKAYRKHSQYHDRPPAERCLLYCLLMVDDYTVKVKDESHIKVYNSIRERYFTNQPVYEEILAPQNSGDIVHIENDMIKFKSGDIRHDVMYAFITECLVKDSDLNFFLTTASRDVISEYCRLWNYKKSKGEKCLYIPGEMYDLFIDRLQLDILTHSAVLDEYIHDRISKRLKIPKEVLSWDIKARRRYVKSSKEQGRKKLFYARGMLVGCAGAGKTTLLIKLQNKETINDEQLTETTVGLEVHDELFEIESGTLKDHEETSSVLHSDKQLISMTDFAGQVAYYACHQVYLSRRAFYLLVVDMSKDLTDEVHKHNRDRHDPLGSLFHHWTYLDYLIFWLQCIKTYCDVGKRRVSGSETESEGECSPVILVASHKDETNSGEDKITTSDYFWKLKNALPKGFACLNLLSSNRYFEVECPPSTLNDQQRDAIENVKQCIVETVTQLPQWGEEIPSNWIEFVGILNKKKKKGVRILKRDELRNIRKLGFSSEEDLDDMLRFFQEIGHIIYFGDEKLRDTVIINVQWFVDAFKHIITDRKHVPSENTVCDEWMQTGRIPISAFHKIWKDSKDNSYICHENDILPYMQKLGLMTQELKNSVTNESMYYVPSMNRVEFSPDFLNIINEGHKTSILIFHFKTYLPHFFFFRLVVHCSAKWEELNPTMFCKNAAFYKTRDYSHCIAIAVNTTSILLQVFTPGTDTNLQTENVVEIRSEVEKHVAEITKTFHKQVGYEIGYSCEDVAITGVEERHFLLEDKVSTFRESVTCPNHILTDRSHYINKRTLIGFWRSDV